MIPVLSPERSAPPLPAALMQRPCLRLDLSRDNPALGGFDLADPVAFGCWLERQIADAGCAWAAGGYAEDRAIYALSPLFSEGGVPRTLHLGVDFWLPAGTPVSAVADGVVHSFADNARCGDYGPTILLEHAGPEQGLVTLYGHLARRSLSGLSVGRDVRAGETIGWLGAPDENLGWAPHLHFQLIADIGAHRGDFPGVCAVSEAAHWLARCPDPAPLIAHWCQ